MVLHVIPARLGAVRLPGKPLADIGGRSMIQRVWERACASQSGRVVVAAGDQEIVDHIQALGGEAVLTDPHLPSGTDRVCAAAAQIDPGRQYGIVTNIQGDMPFLESSTLARGVEVLKDHPEFVMVTPAAPVAHEDEKHTHAVVKVVKTPQSSDVGRALWFSRSCLPSGGEGPFLHHVGLYIWRRDAMEQYARLPQTSLEKDERLEQIRALEHGMALGVYHVDRAPLSVDTPEDLERARILARS